MKRFSNVELSLIFSFSAFLIAFSTSFYLLNENEIPKIEPKDNNYAKTFYGTSETKPDKMIIADLLNMRITLVSSTTLETLPIITKGKPGSYYETPVGEYEVGLKSYKHFSTLGEVYMPYSVQFYANFFIHGIPYHTDGTRVSSSYSGGCIRLADVDAKKVYDFATPKMKVLVIGREDTYDQNQIILDAVSAYNILFTVVALESTNQEKEILWNGNKTKIKNITEDIISGNKNARNVIYSQLGNDNINNLMQNKANAIGLNSTTFENETDRKILLNYVYNHKKFLMSFID